MTAISSSRLFVKNLPVKYTDEQVNSSFMTHSNQFLTDGENI